MLSGDDETAVPFIYSLTLAFCFWRLHLCGVTVALKIVLLNKTPKYLKLVFATEQMLVFMMNPKFQCKNKKRLLAEGTREMNISG